MLSQRLIHISFIVIFDPATTPLSPLLAEIYMSHLEDTISSPSNSYFHYIKFWKRYVDDILVVWSGTMRQIDSFEIYLNSLNPKIQFASELGNKTIPFLDLQITINNNQIKYQIYRKPSFTDTVIPYSSNHPHNTKCSAFYAMFYWLINILLNTEDFRQELTVIHKIAENNNYPRPVINNISNKVIAKKISTRLYAITPKINTIYKKTSFSFQYLTNPITITFAKLDITPALYNRNNLSSYLIKNKIDKINPHDKSGVYQLQCNNCEAFYIGQTGRSIKDRHHEHKRSLKQLQLNSDKSNTQPLSYVSAFGDHLFNNNHSPSIENPLILNFTPKGCKLDGN